MTMIPMLTGLALISALGQQVPLVQPMTVPEPPNTKPAAVEKLGPTTYKVGSLIIDTAKREVRVPGVVNDVVMLEFVANTRGGYKAYESALTLDTNGVNFNVAMLLIGLDVRRGRAAARQFDPTPPEGDPVDVFVEWMVNGTPQRVRVERLLYDQRTRTTLPEGPWVYTGSTFVETGDGRQYLADLDGVLIGFMHGPQAILDNPRNHAVDGFGAVKLNPTIGLPPGTAVTLTVKALPLAGK
ncbi:MAG: Uncharacterized protein FD127_2385 [Acidimicrobiaceae bacterium]|nr:MAG: Uncharacterized protein FD127_2385 [Acidimicrobiaceae bacterium]